MVNRSSTIGQPLFNQDTEGLRGHVGTLLAHSQHSWPPVALLATRGHHCLILNQWSTSSQPMVNQRSANGQLLVNHCLTMTLKAFVATRALCWLTINPVGHQWPSWPQEGTTVSQSTNGQPMVNWWSTVGQPLVNHDTEDLRGHVGTLLAHSQRSRPPSAPSAPPAPNPPAGPRRCTGSPCGRGSAASASAPWNV